MIKTAKNMSEQLGIKMGGKGEKLDWERRNDLASGRLEITFICNRSLSPLSTLGIMNCIKLHCPPLPLAPPPRRLRTEMDFTTHFWFWFAFTIRESFFGKTSKIILSLETTLQICLDFCTKKAKRHCSQCERYGFFELFLS